MPHMKWPPKLIRTDILGEVIDTSNRRIRRDIGKPVHLGPNTYYVFGDTFCHDHHGSFQGVTDNTIAYVPDPVNEPTKSTYLDGKVLVENYIPHSEEEVQFTNHPEHKKQNDRMVVGSFSGIVEDEPGCGKGWMFFDKMVWHGAKPGQRFGTSVSRASLNPDKTVKIERPMGNEMLFGEHEPLFGSNSVIELPDGYVYLMGAYDPTPGSLDLRSHLARVRKDADFTKRENYQFWVNTMDMKGGWRNNYERVDDLARLQELDTQSQGALLYLPDFAPQGRPYLWLGVNKFGVGHAYAACAPEITGPWEVQDLGKLPDDQHGEKGGMKYCLYPNPRASDLARGEMVMTWTDASELGGKIIAARFWFEGDYERPPPPPPQGASHGHGGLGDKLKGKLEGFLHR